MLNRLRVFMTGRNGIDKLSVTLLIAALIINGLCGRFLPIGLVALPVVMVALALFRIFSRNVVKRRNENYKFVNFWGAIKFNWNDWRARRHQSKEYKFFPCPGCKNRLRVPRGKGRLQITCPRCGQRFGGKT